MEVSAASLTDIVEDYFEGIQRVSQVFSDINPFSSNGIGLSRWSILKRLVASPKPMTANELAKALGASRARLLEELRELESSGFVSLSTLRDGGRRISQVSALPLAHEVVRAISQEFSVMTARLEGKVSSERLTRASRLAARVASMMRPPRSGQAAA